MFGFGIRFVWKISGCAGGRGDGAEKEESVEGAVVHHLKAGFVAVHEGEGVGVGGFGEAGGDAVELVAIDLGGDLVVEGAGFERPAAAKAPGGGDHLFDQAVLDFVNRLETGEVLLDKVVETFAGFGLEDAAFREETVTGGVAGGARFAGGGDGAAGLATVGARCDEASLGRHGCQFSVLSFQLSVLSCQLSAISYQLSA
jgi:hypothetical protein